MELINKEYLLLVILLIPIILYIYNMKKNKINYILFVISALLLVVSISRPIVNKGEITVKESFSNIIIGLDMSRSMFSNDVYPNRFIVGKQKVNYLIDNLHKTNIGILGFSSQSFLISPLTSDYGSLHFLVDNLTTDSTNLKGTSILNLLESVNDLDKKENKKLILITDGGDNNNYEEEITLANKYNIEVYIYVIATDNGGPIIKKDKSLLKDKNNKIIIVKKNNEIKKLAFNTNGAYLEYSKNTKDIMKLINKIQPDKEKTEKQKVIKDSIELFYYTLAASIIFFLLSLFYIRKKNV